MFERLTDNKEIVILDLEWNQGTYYTNPRIPHEIIEMGAVKIDPEGNIVSKFSRIVHPQIYKRMDRHIQSVTGITQAEIDQGEGFSTVFSDFTAWCKNARLVTWGRDDYPVLKRNVEYYHIHLDIEPPIDAQLLFGFLFYEDETRQMNLHSAIEQMEIKDEIPAHRAIYDAEATSLLLPFINRKLEEAGDEALSRLFGILEKEKRVAKARVVSFPTYHTLYTEAIRDPRVTRLNCPVCNKRMTFSVPWFDSGKEKYECLCHCKEHGDLVGNMHFRKSTNGKIIINQRILLAVEDQVRNVRNKYHAFKMIPENKRHHRLEMKI